MNKKNPRLIPGRAAAIVLERVGDDVDVRVITGSEEWANTAALMLQAILLDSVDFVDHERMVQA